VTLALGHERSGLPSGLFLVGGQCRLVGSVISIRFRHHAITHFLHTGSLRGDAINQHPHPCTIRCRPSSTDGALIFAALHRPSLHADAAPALPIKMLT